MSAAFLQAVTNFPVSSDQYSQSSTRLPQTRQPSLITSEGCLFLCEFNGEWWNRVFDDNDLLPQFLYIAEVLGVCHQLLTIVLDNQSWYGLR